MLTKATRRDLIRHGIGAAGLLVAARTAFAQSSSRLSVAFDQEPNTFDIPHFSTSHQAASVVRLVEEGLAEVDARGRLRPLLAERWEVSQDGRTWTFHLRRGVRFHDGTPFNADAVRFTVDRILADVDPIVGKKSINQFVLKGISATNIVDDYTIQFVTQEPFAPFVSNFAYGGGIGIASPTAVRKAGPAYGLRPVGTGAYRLTEWVKGDRIVFTRNADHWAGGNGAQTMTIHVVPDDAARALGLRSGDYDIIGDVAPAQAQQLRNTRGIGVTVTPTNRVFWVIPNVRSTSPTGRPEVRQALNLAIDRDAIVKDIMLGFGQRADTILAPLTPGYSSVGRYEYNPAKAKQLLAAAGYANGFAMKLVHSPWVPQNQALSEAVQGYLQEVGIQTTLTQLEPGAYWTAMGKAPDDYGLWLFDWGPGNCDADTLLTSTFGSKSIPVYNVGAYSNSALDTLIAQQRGEIDATERNRTIAEILRVIYRDNVAIPLFVQQALTGVKLNAKGLWISPSATLGLENIRTGA
jgi:ABC-type transport system substrate-binding protein